MNNRRETFERRHGGAKELWVTARRRERRSEEHITLYFTHIHNIIILYSSYYNGRERLSASERQREIVGRSEGGRNLILINVYSKRRRRRRRR